MNHHPVLRRFFPAVPFYIQITSDRLKVSTPKIVRVFEDKPVVAIDLSGRKPKVAGFGAKAEQSSHKLIRPFSHNRLLVHEFESAAMLLKHALACVAGEGLLRPAPIAVIHPMKIPADGHTDIEDRVFRELALSAGARDVYIWQGRVLTNMELTNGVYENIA